MKPKIDRIKLVFAILFSVAYLFSTFEVSLGQDMMGPDYASSKTKEVIQKMLKAHGGLEKWKKVKSLSFDNIFFNPAASQMEWPSPWWVSHEVIDLKNRRAYHDWPLDNAKLTFDGEKVWTVDWKNGNMPKMQAMFFFYFAALPFLTQDSNVRLGEPGMAKLPGFDKEYITVVMGFTEKPTIGKTDKDSFKLFIDPDTHILQDYEYKMGFGAMLDAMGLPPEAEVFGPMLRIHDKFTKVNGLTFPTELHTMPPDGSTIYGNHVLFNYSLTEKFDESRMKMSINVIIDKSNAERKAGK